MDQNTLAARELGAGIPSSTKMKASSTVQPFRAAYWVPELPPGKGRPCTATMGRIDSVTYVAYAPRLLSKACGHIEEMLSVRWDLACWEQAE